MWSSPNCLWTKIKYTVHYIIIQGLVWTFLPKMDRNIQIALWLVNMRVVIYWPSIAPSSQYQLESFKLKYKLMKGRSEIKDHQKIETKLVYFFHMGHKSIVTKTALKHYHSQRRKNCRTNSKRHCKRFEWKSPIAVEQGEWLDIILAS